MLPTSHVVFTGRKEAEADITYPKKREREKKRIRGGSHTTGLLL